jgi:ubiquinone/menaquinone biosynthesis C-methylase UbiE
MIEKKTKDIDFSKRAAAYDGGIMGKASQRFYNLLIREVELQPKAVVLDVGCGTGTILKRLANKADIVGYGVDIAEKMIAEAKKKCPQMNFTIASCDKLPFSNQTFDVVTACMAYHHFSNQEGFAKEAARILKPGGVLYITDPRFPWIVRKTLNGFFRLFRTAGAFHKPKEIENRLAQYGFTGIGTAVHGYAQIVKLRKGGQNEMNI